VGKICEKGETNSSEEELVSERIMASAGNGYIDDLPSGSRGISTGQGSGAPEAESLLYIM